MELMKSARYGKVHIQRSAEVPLCGHHIKDSMPVASSEEVTCGVCLRVQKSLEPVQVKTCSVCKNEKDIDEFYYNSALDSLDSKCKECYSKFEAMKKQYRKEGKKLSVKEFREKRFHERMVVASARVQGGKKYKVLGEIG